MVVPRRAARRAAATDEPVRHAERIRALDLLIRRQHIPIGSRDPESAGVSPTGSLENSNHIV
jgi:hypothetical protein